MQKLDWQLDGEWQPHSHSAVFTTEITSAGTARLLAGVPVGDFCVPAQLIKCLAPPFFVLYVLHTPRGEGTPGRYQSPQLSGDELQAFLDRFASFFAGDSRFDLRVHSPATKGTIVWDRHNLVYGYGPIECFCEVLQSISFTDGVPIVPTPHAHHYRQQFDGDAKALLSMFPWQIFPLQPQDEQ
ncbi:hypothetical protein ACHMW6_10445 [Pseudoduganella sp. UC29_106]|uniref:hypothetical protein n=1 Tax=Pseudoduganella sp. UC29_106 TaxID=3374553 RepID=UPI0037577A74